MKKIFTFIIVLVTTTISFSQQQIINSDFEQWDLYPGSNGYPDYENPSPNGTWATGNLSSQLTLGVTPTVTKTTDCISGSYAVKMTTQEIFNLSAAGSCWLGTFSMDGFTPITTFGTPYTDKPNYFTGYYKYIPVDGDSCHIYSYLSKWNSSTSKRDTIAWASLMDTVTFSEYQYFSLKYEYYSQETPDSITMVFTSSADGENYQGAIGSTLYLDNVKLKMTAGVSEIKNKIIFNLFPNPFHNVVKINTNIKTKSKYVVLNITGQEIKTGILNSKLTYIDFSKLTQGIYFIKIISGNNIAIKKIIKN